VRRALGIGALAAALAVALLLVLRGGGDEGSYLVRAEFRNAFTVSEGEDVKIAGVTVGRIRALDVTERQTAAVVLDITEPGFQDFRRDAECTIRPQSLIGEKFVECTPTRPREAGHAARAAPARDRGRRRAPALPARDEHVAARGPRPRQQHAAPALPPALSLILNELGAGLAGRGEDLRRVIRTADPALKETDEVLEILASRTSSSPTWPATPTRP
jgi:ABC-type transporter Mla subunit MlaD